MVSRVAVSKAIKGFFYTKFFKIMIYKFIEESGNVSLEFEQVGNDTIKVRLEEIHPEGNEIDLSLNTKQLYDLIGALHSIQAKIKKEGSNE